MTDGDTEKAKRQQQDYINAVIAITVSSTVVLCFVLPIVAVVLGFCVRCFLWAGGFRAF